MVLISGFRTPFAIISILEIFCINIKDQKSNFQNHLNSIFCKVGEPEIWIFQVERRVVWVFASLQTLHLETSCFYKQAANCDISVVRGTIGSKLWQNRKHLVFNNFVSQKKQIWNTESSYNGQRVIWLLCRRCIKSWTCIALPCVALVGAVVMQEWQHDTQETPHPPPSSPHPPPTPQYPPSPLWLSAIICTHLTLRTTV